MRNIVEEALNRNIGIQDHLVPLLPKVQYPLQGHMTISPREISPVCRNPNESSWNSGSSIRDKRYLKHFLCNPGQPNETTFQLTLTCLRLKYSPSKGHESKFWT
uniref:Uncharacterized protein n=2 Tax=Candidatus Kentrum sp. LPFa TaxID=2126335 RepID=A0A450Y410_9GAMM|nr:MAG: hypothetical protein BECKLPF1236A_GA0070988_105741 [Candidatus Kentron sp. LPFa]VFK36255.1 MAG: hypothetical protein BECKLPF1236C_GA0070990_105511 [Candidatus Kentron sp. LPFa]